MTAKTAAELQLEFLKKLKEQQSGLAPRKRLQAAARAGKLSSAVQSLRASRKAPASKARKIPLSGPAWRLLKSQAIDNGRYQVNQSLGDWIVELLLNLPEGFKSLSPVQRAEVFQKVKEWVEAKSKI